MRKNSLQGLFCLLALQFCINISFAKTIIPESIAESKEFRLAATFLNGYRELLDSRNDENKLDLIRRSKEDGFKYLIGNDNIYRRLTGEEDFSISFENGYYKASWSENSKLMVSCTFPANIGLLTFSNKIELENLMLEKLRELSDSLVDFPLPKELKTNLVPVSFSDFYIKDDGYFIIPRLKNSLVYTSIEFDQDSCQLLTDGNQYRLESLANIVLSGYSPVFLPIMIKANLYGYKSEILELPFSTLYRYFIEEGCKPYWGIETFDGQVVKGLYVWENPQGGYAHVLEMELPVKILRGEGEINSKLNCYVRTDNLKNLFADFDNL